jgi:transposase InsO family protein
MTYQRAIRFVIRDGAGQYARTFDDVFAAIGATAITTPPGAPQANAFAERWVRTVRHELLDQTLIWNQRQVRHEAPSLPGGDERTPLPGCRSSPVKLRAA